MQKEMSKLALEGGIPVGAHYVKVIYEEIWIRERKAYGNSGYPWNCPLSGKKIDYTHCCPRAERAVEDHMTLSIP